MLQAAGRYVWRSGQASRLSYRVVSLPVIRAVSGSASAEAVTEPARPFSEIPGPKGLPLIGNTLSLIFDTKQLMHSHESLLRNSRKYGPIFREDMGPFKAVAVASPELIQEVFRKEEKYPTREPEIAVYENYRQEHGNEKGILSVGEEWFRARRIFNKKMLRPKEVEAYAPGFDLVTTDLLKKIDEIRNERGEVDNLREQLFRWALENIGLVLFERRLGGIGEVQDESSQQFIERTRELISMFLDMEIFGYPAFLLKIYKTKKVKHFESLLDTMYAFNTRMITEKLRKIEEEYQGAEIKVPENGRVDFLTYLLASKEMTVAKISANFAEMLAAAIDTTSGTTTWLLYSLAENQDVQEELYQEITSTLPPGASPSPGDIQAMPYLRACLKESLRMYPSAPENMRIPSQETVIGGYRIPAGTLLRMPLFTLGRDERSFPEPLKFKPERWLRGSAEPKHHPFAMLPFGFGTRSCLGRRIAELEMELFLCRFFQKYRVENIGEKPKPITLGLLTTEKPVSFKIIER